MIWPRIKQFRLLIMSVLSLTACNQDKAIEYFRLEEMLENLGPSRDILRMIAIVAGLTLLFAGWRIYRFGVVLPGFLIGAGCGAWLSYQVLEMWQAAVIGLIVGGLIGAWLSMILHNLAVFVIGAIAAVFILNEVWSLLFSDPPNAILLIVLGIIGGVVLLAMSKHWMILLSSLVGATMLAWSIPTSIWLMFVFFSFGVIVQYSISKATDREISTE
jgi:hypothetical protein